MVCSVYYDIRQNVFIISNKNKIHFDFLFALNPFVGVNRSSWETKPCIFTDICMVSSQGTIAVTEGLHLIKTESFLSYELNIAADSYF